MKRKKEIRQFLYLLAVIMGLLCLPSHVQAKSAWLVKYSTAKKGYYLYNDAGSPAARQGLYKISGLKAKSRTFDGIYYVSSQGKISTDSAVRYLPSSKTIDGKNYYKGFYHFGKGGRLSARQGVVYCKNLKINGHTFRGYYYYNQLGRIHSRPFGLIYLDCRASDKKQFKGWYYRDDMSRIDNAHTIHNITRKSGCSAQFPGYHYFGKNGRLDTTRCARKLNLTYKGRKYKGYYCFAGAGGQMVRKKGLVCVGDDCYYVTDPFGKCLTNGKKKIKGLSYTFRKNGRGRRTSTNMKRLNTRLNSMIKGYGGKWSVYVKRLDNNDSLTINNSTGFAASLIKAFTMASAYEQIELGNLQETAAVKSLLNSMITISSNESYNEMVMRQSASHDFHQGRAVVNQYLKKNNYTKTQVHTSYGSYFVTDGKMNVTSVKDCGMLLESIYQGTCVSKDSSKKMLNLLLGQQLRSKIPAGLPAGTKTANKTGENHYSDHDIAIVYSPECTYILCVMSFYSSNAPSKIASISRTVYQYFNYTREPNDLTAGFHCFRQNSKSFGKYVCS